jgi:hypothetical protein
MKLHLLLTAVALLSLVNIALGTEPSAISSEPPKGSVVLWNGRDLGGWTVFFKEPEKVSDPVWSLHDTALNFRKVDSLGYVRTEESYGDYHLHVEWRWPDGAGNSGVLLHMQAPDAVWTTCMEAQLKSGAAGFLIAMGSLDFEGGAMDRGRRRKPPVTTSVEKPVGEWNRYDIFCRGNTIAVYVNDQLMNRVEKVSPTSGYIGLQCEGAAVEFKNVWLLPLDRKNPE